MRKLSAVINNYLCGFILAMCCASAWSDGAKDVEEVIVFAQMRAEPLRSAPIAVGVYDAKWVRRVGASSLTEMESSIPNLNFGRGGRSTRGEIAIRGIGDFSRNIGMDARVAVYVDDVLTGRSSSFDQSLLDIDHIEVLRGPQGTLAGTNALAGAINIITQQPGNNFDTKWQVSLGDYNQRSVAGKVNLPLTADLSASLLLSKTQQDGYIDNITLARDLQGVNRSTAALKFRYLGLERLTLDVGFDYLQDDINGTNAEALANGPFNGYTLAPAPYKVAHNADEYERRTLGGARIKALYQDLQGFEWVSITGIRASEFSELSEEDYSPLDVASSLFDEKNDQLSQEFRLVSPRGDKVDYVLGTFFLNQDISTQRRADTGSLFRAAPNASVVTPASADVNSASLYAHGNYYVTDKLSLNAGIRYVDEKKGIDYSSIDTIGLFVNVDNLTQQQHFTEWLPKFGISFEPNESVLFYSSIARGYKSGGWNADFISTLANFQFNPEYAINYELGAKSSLWRDALTLNLSTFVTKIEDFQVFQFVPTATGGTILSLTNAGQVTSKGIELDIKAALSSALTFTLNTAFTQAQFDEFKNGGGIGRDYDGNTLAYAPEQSVYTALDYAKALNVNSQLYAHLDYSYTSDYFSNPSNTPENSIPAHSVASARLGVLFGGAWDISLWVKNITNEINLRQRSVSFVGVSRGFYDVPRSYGVAVQWSMD